MLEINLCWISDERYPRNKICGFSKHFGGLFSRLSRHFSANNNVGDKMTLTVKVRMKGWTAAPGRGLQWTEAGLGWLKLLSFLCLTIGCDSFNSSHTSTIFVHKGQSANYLKKSIYVYSLYFGEG